MCQCGVAGVTDFFVRLSSSKPPSGQTCSDAKSGRNSKERSCYISKHRQDVELTWGSCLRSMKSCLPFFYHIWCRWQDAPPATEHKMAVANIAIACHAWTIAVNRFNRSHRNILLMVLVFHCVDLRAGMIAPMAWPGLRRSRRDLVVAGLSFPLSRAVARHKLVNMF